ncbi:MULTISPECIES: RNA-binding S4 domain-containing protein [unclassified Synechococcus]|uniref:RNA-binding S4 domain-containing protein n=1 Tax=unclassified Synechococcus TaxID=2626047 RepID=UPI0039AE987C
MRLDQFLKWQGWVGTGGEAKMLIQGGQVRVNDSVVTQRGRQLKLGDRVDVGGDQAVVTKI